MARRRGEERREGTHFVVDAAADLRADGQAGGDEGVVQGGDAGRQAVALLPERFEGRDGELVEAEEEAHEEGDDLDNGLGSEQDEGALELVFEGGEGLALGGPVTALDGDAIGDETLLFALEEHGLEGFVEEEVAEDEHDECEGGRAKEDPAP